MESLTQFIIAHWLPCLLFVLLLLLVTYEETKGRLQQQTIPLLLPDEVVDLINHQGGVVVDIRQAALFEQGHIAGAVNLPDVLPDTLTEAKLKPLAGYQKNAIILASEKGGQPCIALAKRLQQHGFPTVNVLSGGLAAWQRAGLPLSGA